MKHSCWWLTCCIAFAGLLGPGPSAWAIRTANYFPIDYGNNWSYSATPGGLVNVAVSPFVSYVNGVATRELVFSIGQNFRQYFTNDANGIVQHQETDFGVQIEVPDYGILTCTATLTLDNGFRIAAADATLFQTVNSAGTATFLYSSCSGINGINSVSFTVPYSGTSTVQALEDVNVPAGTFSALRIAISLTISGTVGSALVNGSISVPINQSISQTVSTTDWVASNVGVVKEVDNSDGTISVLNVPPSYFVPALTPSTGSLAFELQPRLTTSPQQLVTLTNTGTVNINSPFISVAGDQNPGEFVLGSNDCLPNIAVGEHCTIGISFSPLSAGAKTGTASIFIGNDYNYPHQVVTFSGNAGYTRRGDFDGNGKSDVLWRNAVTGAVVQWQMNATAIASAGSPATVADLNWRVVGAGDFDGDGKSDVLWQNRSTGQVVIWLMNGMTLSTSGSPNTVADLNWQVQGVGDFDGDGKADVLWQNRSTGQVVIWLMNGMAVGSAGSPNTVADLNWVVQGVGDFDGDGKTDVLWQNRHTGQLVMWLMNGMTINSAGSPNTVADLDWQVQGVGDFDGDGKADVLWQNRSNGTVVTWLMNGAAIGSSGSPGTVADLRWQVQSVGDYDGDGKADVLWQHRTRTELPPQPPPPVGSGQTVLWLMKGLAISNAGSPNTVSDLTWQVQNPK